MTDVDIEVPQLSNIGLDLVGNDLYVRRDGSGTESINVSAFLSDNYVTSAYYEPTSKQIRIQFTNPEVPELSVPVDKMIHEYGIIDDGGLIITDDNKFGIDDRVVVTKDSFNWTLSGTTLGEMFGAMAEQLGGSLT